ncbi:ABC transporter permease [Candidatus Woesearchaeota archaeon]|nr:ABC transporter permease [Candidatus Woesearchaeota archaeon]
MIIDYFRMAFRNLARRRMRSWLTLIGIIIGITSVVALIGLGEGLRTAITGIFGDLGTDKLTVSATGGFGPPGTAVINPLTVNNLEKMKRMNGVEIAAGRLLRAGTLMYNEKISFGYAASIPEEPDERKVIYDTLDLEAEEGRLLKATDTKKVMLGSGLGELEEYFGKDIVTGSRVQIQDTTFMVVGILEDTGNPIFDNIVIMNDDDLRDTFGIDNEVIDIIVVQLENEDDGKRVKEDIEKYLRRDRDVREGEEDFSVSTPEEMLQSVNSTLGAVNLFVIIIASISILVGGIGIMNTMFTSVTERTRQIGIMKSIGARNSTIFSLFFIESGLLGSVGGLLGAVLGSLIAVIGSMALQGFLGGELEIRAQISIWLFMGSVLGSFLIGSLFGIIPAMGASRMHPVDALRRKK